MAIYTALIPHLRNILRPLLIMAASVAAYASSSYALTPEHFATSSQLAEGRWTRISVKQTGMHLITDTELRAAGFSDPSKVHVFGLGGRTLPEALSETMPDDLPLLPSVRTPRGIVFFATDQFTWQPQQYLNTPYSHIINPYSDNCYYFLSDRPVTEKEMAAAAKGSGGDVLSTFYDRRVHERDMQNPGESGRLLLGEDFRSLNSQKFNFELPDNVGEEVLANVRFGAKTTNGGSTLSFTANGTKVEASSYDRISSVTSTEQYTMLGSTLKRLTGIGDRLEYGISFAYTGALFNARLDYIEIFYERDLRLSGGQLYFFNDFEEDGGMQVSGCSASTRIWEVTDPHRPLLVDFTLQGDKATFNATKGYHEYVAFDADKVTLTPTRVAGVVANQDIHGMEEPDMLIISPAEYMNSARRIAAVHEKHDSMKVAVLTPEQIYNEFSGGTPDVSAFRLLLKMWHDRASERNISYCLIIGKPTFDPKGNSAELKGVSYIPVPIWQSDAGLTETTSYSNDDYIGMLDDVEPDRMNLASARCTVAVGRIPATSVTDAETVADKIEKYIEHPDYGAWRNKVMIIADDGDNGVHFTQAQKVYDNMRSNGNGGNFIYDRVYLDSYKLEYTSIGATYPQATQRMLQNYNDGVILTNYIGHASATGWGHEHLWTWEDIVNMANPNLTFIYAATCGFAYWDAPSVSGAEHLLFNPDGGVIGLMAATRTVYIAQNGTLNDRTSRHFFERDSEGLPRRFGDVYILGKNDIGTDSNKLRYAFIGDPSIRIPSPVYGAEITSLQGTDMTSPDTTFPELEANSSPAVEGRILAPDGSVATDFNGTANILLYDAERVITTYGNGSNGKEMTYNDRKTRLTTLNVRVKDGVFSGTLNLPSEIENNYSPARITVYAWDESGREANGSCERLYVYGYNDNPAADTDGPAIESIYLNNDWFESGDVVNSSPVLFARVSDPSGINLSDAGIGHKMSAIVDGSQVFDDVSAYFTSDPDAPGAGDVCYPLKGLTPGKHSLLFTVWDNANNVSKQEIEFNVGAALDPMIRDLTTDCNPASTSVVFQLTLDRPNTKIACRMDIFDLNGRRVWDSSENATTDLGSTMTTRWDLRDRAGHRVPRGIYLYRATVETPEGTYTSKTGKLAVTAQ